MEIICSLAYITIRREVTYNEQLDIETEHHLYLYKDKIITAAKKIPLKNVFDISYKLVSDGYGFLYLHTNQGVLTYNVKTDPHHFINAYKKYR